MNELEAIGATPVNPIDGKKLLSLDVFDTSLYRTVVQPEDVNLVLDTWSEERTERWLCVCNKLVKPWYYEAFRKSVPVVFVTDTDHPASLIHSLLNEAGYNGRIYASSEYGKSKTSGLYEEMLKAEGVEPEDVLHVGDNRRSDYEYPLSIGMNAKLLDRLQDGLPEPYRRHADNQSLFALSHFNALAQIGTNYWYDVGHNAFGPALVAFAWWLDHTAKKDGRDRLYFMSSEGRTLMDVYNRVVPDPLPSKYLYGSRRAWAVPAITGDEGIDQVLQDRVLFQWKDGGNNPDEPLADIAARERPLVEKYLRKMKVPEGRPGFVDIGYSGTMQLALKKYGIEAPWYYLATSKQAGALDQHGLPYRSYMCHRGAPATRWLTIANGTPILESILSQDQGTTLGYDDKGPVLHHYKTNEEHAKAVMNAIDGILEFAQACACPPAMPVLAPAHACAGLLTLLDGEKELDRLMLPRLVYYAVMGAGDKKHRYRSLTPMEKFKWLLSIKLKG